MGFENSSRRIIDLLHSPGIVPHSQKCYQTLRLSMQIIEIRRIWVGTSIMQFLFCPLWNHENVSELITSQQRIRLRQTLSTAVKGYFIHVLFLLGNCSSEQLRIIIHLCDYLYRLNSDGGELLYVFIVFLVTLLRTYNNYAYFNRIKKILTTTFVYHPPAPEPAGPRGGNPRVRPLRCNRAAPCEHTSDTCLLLHFMHFSFVCLLITMYTEGSGISCVGIWYKFTAVCKANGKPLIFLRFVSLLFLWNAQREHF